MKTIPAVKINMGVWEFFLAKAKLKQLQDLFVFAESLEEKPDLFDAMLQRELDEGRASGDMADFLKGRDDRFYGAVVVANLVDNPVNWTPVQEEAFPEMISPSSERHGYLTLNETDEYYVLDGQHRVASIEAVMNDEAKPEGFGNEEISLLIIPRPEESDDTQMKVSYRRLFTSLNRNAKPTKKNTNIAMDEDDAFAIVTRNVIREFPPFDTTSGEEGNPLKNPNILFQKNLPATASTRGVPQFSSLETIYEMNRTILKCNRFPELNPADKEIYKFRPTDRELSKYTEEAVLVWQAIFETFPEFTGDRTNLRKHNADVDSDSEFYDHVFLWPLMQEGVLAHLVRELIDREGVNSQLSYTERLAKLKEFQTDFRKPPWHPLILRPNDPDAEEPSNTITSERRKTAVSLSLTLSRYLLGIIELDDKKKKKLKNDINTEVRGILNTQEKFNSYWEACENEKIT